MPEFDIDAALAGLGEDEDFGLGWIGNPDDVPPWGYGDPDLGEEASAQDDIEEAARQGWGLFGDGYGNTQLQRLYNEDGPSVFEEDGLAWDFVWSHRLGDYTCAKALVSLRNTSPAEFECIRQHAGS